MIFWDDQIGLGVIKSQPHNIKEWFLIIYIYKILQIVLKITTTFIELFQLEAIGAQNLSSIISSFTWQKRIYLSPPLLEIIHYLSNEDPTPTWDFLLLNISVNVLLIFLLKIEWILDLYSHYC